ncbi:unnamed protein product [marine sediment metagenome]|uniref:Uncharacterized protein n=1 Tax=marine sediment metagenome TaxID=412755 RepID=X1NMP9_9ZZZZ
MAAAEDDVREGIASHRIAAGTTDVSFMVTMVDNENGKTPETGLTETDFVITYARVGAAAVSHAGIALTAIDDAHVDWGVFEIDDTNMKGLYRIDMPDAAFAVGVNNVNIFIKDGVITRTSRVNVDLQGKLSPDGLDAVSFTEPSGYPTNLREGLMLTIMQVVNRVTQTGSEKKIYQDDNSSVALTQALTDDETTQTQLKGA